MKWLRTTLKSLSNFPANASKRVVFPEEGGPSKRAILKKQKNKNGYTNLGKVN